MRLEDWFLTADERGNLSSLIDQRRGDGVAWSKGNRVDVLVDGSEYFRRLYDVLCTLSRGDWVHFTDWDGDADERLRGPGTEIGRGTRRAGATWCTSPWAAVAFAPAPSALRRAR